MNGRERSGLVDCREGADGHIRPADAPGYRRRDAGVRHVDARRLHGRLVRFHVSLGLIERRSCVVVILPADRVDWHEFLVALRPRPDGRDVRLGPRKTRLRARVGSLVHGRVDLVELVARFYVGPFNEKALLDDPAYLGPHLRDKAGTRSSGQFHGEGNPLRLHGDDRHFRRAGRRSAGLGRFSACRQGKERDNKG